MGFFQARVLEWVAIAFPIRIIINIYIWDIPWWLRQESTCNAGDLGSISGLGRSPGEGNGNPLQYSCLEDPMGEEPGRLQSMGSQRVGHD